MNQFYYINNICDHNIGIGGEILVVLDDKKNVIWHHDWSDSTFDFPEQLPRSFMKEFLVTNDSRFIRLDESDIKPLKKKVKKYLLSQGCESL